MASMTDRDKRTAKIAGILIVGYLSLFYGGKAIGHLEEKRADYQRLVSQQQELTTRILTEQGKHKQLAKLRGEWKTELSNFDSPTLFSDLRAAISNCAKASRVGLGASQESARGAKALQLLTIQLQGSGTIETVARFTDQLPRQGYPIVIDRMQIKAVPKKLGRVTFTMSVSVMNYGASKKGNKRA